MAYSAARGVALEMAARSMTRAAMGAVRELSTTAVQRGLATSKRMMGTHDVTCVNPGGIILTSKGCFSVEGGINSSASLVILSLSAFYHDFQGCGACSFQGFVPP